MACGDAKFDLIPSYVELIKGIIEFTGETVRRGRRPEEDSWNYVNFEVVDIVFVVIAAALFTGLRHCMTAWIFKPVGETYALTYANQKKMPESAWRFVYYLCAWTYDFYVLILSGHYCFFQRPSLVWEGWNLSKGLPLDIYIMYIVQSGFYVHSLYATLFLDTWRKDSIIMLVHHILTVALIFISYSLRYHNIGLLVLFLHDLCDMQLEFTKLNVYFKTQDGKLVKRHEILANVAFFLFTLSWFVCRLYWYPLKVLYSTTSVVSQKNLILPCAILMNVLLWILQAMNIYWFVFVLGLLVRVATGQLSEVEDTREFDVEEKFSRKSRKPDTNDAEENSTKEKNMNAMVNGESDVGGSSHVRKRQK